jgi:hypothetical protein
MRRQRPQRWQRRLEDGLVLALLGLVGLAGLFILLMLGAGLFELARRSTPRCRQHPPWRPRTAVSAAGSL